MLGVVRPGQLGGEAAVGGDERRVEATRRFEIDQVVDRVPQFKRIQQRRFDQFIDWNQPIEVIRQRPPVFLRVRRRHQPNHCFAAQRVGDLSNKDLRSK